MFVKTNAAVGIDCGGDRFRDVVQDDTEHERHGNFFRQKLEHEAGVLKYIALRMELGRLLTTFHRLNFGKNGAQQP